MKKTYPVSAKVHGAFGWNKHLKKYGKRKANKSTRQAGKHERTVPPNQMEMD